jgi:hypothetical protein
MNAVDRAKPSGPRGAIAAVLALSVPLALFAACSRSELYPISSFPTDDGGDAGPPLFPDGQVIPTIDATPSPDVAVSAVCADASATLVYAVTEANTLLRFDPTAGTIVPIGVLACPDPYSAFSMAVDREGVAYVLYFGGGESDPPGNIYRVSLATAGCQATSYVPHNGAFAAFGMGFSANADDGGETLYIASSSVNGTTGELGAVDTSTFLLTDIGGFSPPIVNGELSGTGDGRLFSFYATSSTSSAIVQIDKENANVLAEDPLASIAQGDAWAFAFWGGDFYLFSAPDGANSVVTRFRPSDGSTTQVATYPELIVGAGVSTCAPQGTPP